jgi:hypothetical protein
MWSRDGGGKSYSDRRSKRLDALRIRRKAVVKSHVRVFPAGPIYARGLALTNAIDDLAGGLLGDRTVFHAKPHALNT